MAKDLAHFQAPRPAPPIPENLDESNPDHLQALFYYRACHDIEEMVQQYFRHIQIAKSMRRGVNQNFCSLCETVFYDMCCNEDQRKAVQSGDISLITLMTYWWRTRHVR